LENTAITLSALVGFTAMQATLPDKENKVDVTLCITGVPTLAESMRYIFWAEVPT
jgi:hypothetical protein